MAQPPPIHLASRASPPFYSERVFVALAMAFIQTHGTHDQQLSGPLLASPLRVVVLSQLVLYLTWSVASLGSGDWPYFPVTLYW